MGKSRRLALVASTSAVALLLLAGCGTQRAGSAAIAGDERLTEGQVSDQIDEVTALYDEFPDAERLSDAQLTQAAISWWLNGEVMQAFAAENDVQVTSTQIDQVLGPVGEREQISLAAGVAPSQLQSAARAIVTYQAAAQALAAEGTSEQEVVAQLASQLEQTANSLGVKVNPRFGSGWVPGLEQQLAPRNPERLSSPAEGTEPVPELVPEQ